MNDIIARAIKALRISQNVAEEALNILDANTCRHTTTERQGSIWEACCDCPARWADDRGGRPASGGHDGGRIDTLRASLDEVTSKEVDAIITEMEGWDIDAETKRADAAEAKACELVEHIRRTEEALADGESPDGVWIPRENLPPRFFSTADIRAKWCPVSERDDALATAKEARDLEASAVAASAADREARIEADRDAASFRVERDEVGVQLVAAQAEIARLQGKLSGAIAHLLANNLGCVSDALGILRHADTVPGDALGTPLDESGTTNPDKKGGAK